MLVDYTNQQMIHHDFFYMHENPQETEYSNIRRAIDKNGTKFSLSVK